MLCDSSVLFPPYVQGGAAGGLNSLLIRKACIILTIPDKSSHQNIMCDVTPVNDSISSDGDFEPALDISLLPKVNIILEKL